jgi:DNA-binding transcriptional regulator GbsR (MarR family)
MKLRRKWFAYMKDVYETSKSNGSDLMRDNIKRLKEEYADAKKITQAQVDKEKDNYSQAKIIAEKKLREDMLDYISRLEASCAKAKDWPKPKWNAGGTVAAGA